VPLDETWHRLHGELITFPAATRDLPSLDRLKGFRPGGPRMYERVLVVANTLTGSAAA